MDAFATLPDSYYKYHEECANSFSPSSGYNAKYQCEASCGMTGIPAGFPAVKPIYNDYLKCNMNCNAKCADTDVACLNASAAYSKCLFDSLNYDQYAEDFKVRQPGTVLPDSYYRYHNECVNSFDSTSSFKKIYQCEASCGKAVLWSNYYNN